MKIGFYIVGIADFQDLMPPIITSIRRGHDCRVYIFDCLEKKRQFHCYDAGELIGFVKGALAANEVDCEVNFYGQNEKEKFEVEYDNFAPQCVMLQNAKHRYPIWYPRADKSKVVHFAWHMDSAQALVRGNYKVDLNIVKRENDLIYYGKNIPDWLGLTREEEAAIPKIKTKHFGNFRLEHLNFSSFFQSLNVPTEPTIVEGKKLCFISEAHLKHGKDNLVEVPKFVDRLIDYLHQKDYYIFWKKREKGYPKERWNSPLDFCKNSPDFIVERDLNFPSSITYLPYISDASFVINTSSAYWDIKKINVNTVMLQTKDPGPREHKYIDLVYKKGDPNAPFDMIDMGKENSWESLDAWLQRERSINDDYIRAQRPSEQLLVYIESELVGV